MTHLERLDRLAEHWSAVYRKTRTYHALEKAKEYRAKALRAGVSRRLRKRAMRFAGRG